MSRNWRRILLTWLPVAPVLWLALWLRLYRLDGQSLWSDEGISAVMAGRSIPDILVNAAGDVHPPLYYLMLRGWTAFAGTSEVGLRSLSVCFGVLTVAVTYALARRLFGRTAGLLAATLAAISPYLIHYSQEARMYAPLALWATLTLYLAVRFATVSCHRRVEDESRRPEGRACDGLRQARPSGRQDTAHQSRTESVPSPRPSMPPLAGYALSAAALSLTQYFGIAYLAAPTLAVLLFRPPLPKNWRWWRWWIAGNAAAGAIVLPWAMYVLPRFGGIATGGDPLGRREFLTLAAQTLTFGRAAPLRDGAATTLALAGVAIAGLGMAAWVLGGRRPRLSLRFKFGTLLLLACLLPVVALYLLTLRRAFSFPEYMKLLLPVIPMAAVVLAGGLTGWGNVVARLFASRPVRIALPVLTAVAGLALIGVAVSPALAAYYTDPRLARDDYRGIVAHIARNFREGDAVILDAPEQTEIFNYYAQGQWPQFPLPQQRPIDDDATRRELGDIAGRHRRAWVLLWGWQEADPRRVAETWLNANGFRTADRWFGNVQLALYALPGAGEAATSLPLDAAFAGGIRLEAMTLPATFDARAGLQPGQALPVTLVWRAAATPDKRYSVFVHLTDAGRLPWAQHDSEPGGGTRITTTWQPGETVNDRHGLTVPPGTPPGRYHLLAGLYDSATGVRLAPAGPDADADTVRLGEFSVTRGDTPPLETLAVHNRTNVPLGPLEIVGADLEPVGANGAGGDVKAGAWVDFTLHWRARSQPQADYRALFVLSAGDREVLRQEAPPAAQFPTSQWAAGEIVRDQRRVLLLNVPAGSYRLTAQLVDSEGGVTVSGRVMEVVVQP